MTKLKAALLSFEARKSIGNFLTFVKRKGQQLAEKKPEVPDARTLAQLSWRHMFLKVVALWHALTPAEQAKWESNARPHHLTGYQWFVSQALRPNPGIYLPLQGGTMSGDIDMDKNRLLKLPLPTDPQEAASKTYIDQALENFMWAKFLNDTPSGIGAYFEMAPDPTGEAKSTFTSGVLDTGDDQPLFQWISDAVVSFTTIKTGIIRVHIHAQRIAGNKSITLYAEIYEYTDAAAEVLITTTEICGFLTGDEACIEIHAPLAADYEIAPTSKLLIKFLANVGAAGANVTLNLYAEGLTTSSVSLPIPTSPLIDAEIAFHASIVDAHHAVYTDDKADARIAIHTAIAAAHHTAYSDAEADARIAIHAAIAAAHHARYTNIEALAAAEAKFDDHSARHELAGADVLNLAGLSGLLADNQHIIDAEADARIAIHAAIAAAHHARYTDGEADARIAIHTAIAAAHHTPAVSTKAFFVPVVYGEDIFTRYRSNHIGCWVHHPDDYASFEFRVPWDFTSLTSVKIIAVFRAHDAEGMNLELESSYGELSEASNAHEENQSNSRSEQPSVADKLGSWDASSVLSAIAANDYVGIEALHETASGGYIATYAHIIGLYFRYD